MSGNEKQFVNFQVIRSVKSSAAGFFGELFLIIYYTKYILQMKNVLVVSYWARLLSFSRTFLPRSTVPGVTVTAGLGCEYWAGIWGRECFGEIAIFTIFSPSTQCPVLDHSVYQNGDRSWATFNIGPRSGIFVSSELALFR